jgi:hypothetical protein
MADTRIEVHGLRELTRALKEAENHTPRELQQANLRFAEIIARAARQRAPEGPHEGGGKPRTVVPFSGSIKAQATTRKAFVVFGGQRSPHGPPIEFGGTLKRHASQSRTRVAKRPAVYPAIEAETPHGLQQYELALRALTRNL